MKSTIGGERLMSQWFDIEAGSTDKDLSGAAQTREKIEAIQSSIQTACEKAGRDPAEIKIVAISKGFVAKAIRSAFEAGIRNFGENYLQESLSKQAALQDLPITWNFTGHIQRNKALQVASNFHLLHSVDSQPLAVSLNEAGKKLARKISALIQIKGNPTGYGFSPDSVARQTEHFPALDWLEWKGVMVMAPYAQDPEAARPYFRKAKEIFLQLKERFPATFDEISMGMTEDFPIAVEEGATLLRIGRGIFGERPARK